jgi:glycerol-3-phosphate dehydrogenase
MGLALSFYSLLSLKWNHRYYDAHDVHELNQLLSTDGLKGGYRFFDAQTDDARLVFRIVREAVDGKVMAINYAQVIDILQDHHGHTSGIILKDLAPESDDRVKELHARVIVNATGAWADELREIIGKKSRLRRLRGSHLIFPHLRLPLTRAVSLWHPRDKRPVFAFPWEGVTILGTTDVDHQMPLDTDTPISYDEVEYLLMAVQDAFPSLDLREKDIQATFSGIRSVVDTGKQDPSKESREHALWWEDGLLTITGGKLTTFRLMARQALKSISNLLTIKYGGTKNHQLLNTPPWDEMSQANISPDLRLRILGRYGIDAIDIINSSIPAELTTISNLPVLWSELRWAARSEGVVHLDDLLLRRVRLGLLLPDGGIHYLDRIQSIVQEELGWNNSRWAAEVQRYLEIWTKYYNYAE